MKLRPFNSLSVTCRIKGSHQPKFRLVAAIGMIGCLIAGSLMSIIGLISITFDLAAWGSTGVWPTKSFATVWSMLHIGLFGDLPDETSRTIGWFGALDLSTMLIASGIATLAAGIILRLVVLRGLRD